MTLQLEGKVAIITGAGSGIGRAAALQFAQQGARLVLGDKTDAVHATAQAVQAAGGSATAMQVDAGVEADVVSLVDTALKQYGQLDVAFANAGISGGRASVFDSTPELWTEVLRVNLIGPWLMVKHAGKLMLEQGRGGSIICTASVAGIRSGAGGAHYSASKAGVINLIKTSAQQLSSTGIRVNAICPGLIETGMTERVFVYARENDKMDKVGRLNPLRRAGQPSEIANMALFLASDEASYVNGQAIAVDGGLSSSHPVTRQETGKPAV